MSEELKPCPMCGTDCGWAGRPASCAVWGSATPQPAPGAALAMREAAAKLAESYPFSMWLGRDSQAIARRVTEDIAASIRNLPALPAPVMPDAEPTESMIEAGILGWAQARHQGCCDGGRKMIAAIGRAMLAAWPTAAIDGEEG